MHGPALITVTGIAKPESSKTCVIPTFVPSIPIVIDFYLFIIQIAVINLLRKLVDNLISKIEKILIILLNLMDQIFSKELKFSCRCNLSHLDFLTKIYENYT
jgi:hypothetical protein